MVVVAGVEGVVGSVVSGGGTSSGTVVGTVAGVGAGVGVGTTGWGVDLGGAVVINFSWTSSSMPNLTLGRDMPRPRSYLAVFRVLTGADEERPSGSFVRSSTLTSPKLTPLPPPVGATLSSTDTLDSSKPLYKVGRPAHEQ